MTDFHEHRGRVMGSELVMVVVVRHDHHEFESPACDPADLATSAHVLLSDLEQHWSRFIESSDISRLNLASGRSVEVDPSTFTLLATMQAAHRLTGGAYDPSILPTLVASGYASSRHDAAQRTLLPSDAVNSPGRLTDIVLDPAHGTISLPAGLTLDPGGIGKGLAADLVVSWLLQHGANGALVSIGGDLVAAGDPPTDAGWVVAVERSDVDIADGHGDDVPLLLTMTIDGGGVATSSTRSRRWTHDGTERHHLVDPITRSQSTSDLAGVTVVAPTGWEAEAHATAALLAGRNGVVEYLHERGLEGAAVTLDGMILATDHLGTLVATAGD
ncbi:MAG: FAD:protein FMN transferase [Actinomycetota bacterium]